MLETNEIRVLNAKELDKNKVLAYIKENVRDFYTIPLLEWQYLKEKNNIGGLFFLLQDDKIISSQGMIPINLSIDKKAVLSAKSESSFLSPDFRGKGYFEKLYFETIRKSKADGVNMFWGFTLLAKTWKEKLGFKVENILYESRLQVSFTKALRDLYLLNNSTLKEKGKRLARLLLDFFKKKVHSFSNGHNLDCRTLNLADSREYEVFFSLFEKWNRNYEDFITLEMSHDYLKWRIVENEFIKYTTICLSQNGENIGIVVLNHNNENNVYIVELIVPDPKNIKSAINAISAYAEKKLNAVYLSYIGNIKNKYNLLVFDEFNGLGGNHYNLKEMNFVLRVENENLERLNALEQIERYYINGLWTEGFRI